MRVSVTDLVDRPGATRRLARDVEAPEGGFDRLDGRLRLDLALESVVEGLLVRGTISYGLADVCARCLVDLRRDLEAPVAELYVDPARSEEEVEPGYELVDQAIDLATLMRDVFLTSAPIRLLCREGCLGLCPTCGIDRNEADCGHARLADGEADARWAPLRALRVAGEADVEAGARREPTN